MTSHSIVVRGRLLLDVGWTMGTLVLSNGRIASVVPDDAGPRAPAADLDAPYVAPGLIDLQVNGAFGVEVSDDPAAIATLARALPATGVTAFLPALVTSPVDRYTRVLAAVQAVREAPGARVLGLHAEGPFLSPDAAGAHDADLVRAADWRVLDILLGSEATRLVTIAPELPGALDAIRRLVERGVVVSLGHTRATYDETIRGIDAGARMVTHLYNAMSPLHHREPGAVGAALTDDRVVVAVVADGVHAHAAALRLALRAKGAAGVALVSDAIAAAGTVPGPSRLAGRDIVVDATSARLADGTLAGSILTLDEAVRRMMHLGGASSEDALRMASRVPARVLGLADKGRLAEGCDGDLVLLDDDHHVRATIVAGEIVYSG